MDSSKLEVQVQTNNLIGHQQKQPDDKDKSFTKILQSCFIIPQRFVMGILCLFAMFNGYTMRVCLNLAITQMVNHTKNTVTHFDSDACPSDEERNSTSLVSNTTTILLKSSKPYAIFDWDEETQGLILSGFYYGYATTQILGGYLSERFGAKWVIGGGLLSTAVFTFLTPVVTRWGGYKWLFALRVAQGIGQGPLVPALMATMARWIPPNERAFHGALIFGGSHLGNVFGSIASGVLLADGKDWANVFYFFGGIAIIWFIFWSFLAFSTPNSHPYISKKELDFLSRTVKINKYNSTSTDPVPWRAILRAGPVWAIVAGLIGHDWGFYIMINDLPKYSHDVLKFNIASTGYLTSLPYIAQWASSFLFGVVCDYCIRKKYHSIKMGRIIHTTIATMGPALCIILASYAGCNRAAAMIYFILSMTLMGGFYSGLKVNFLDIAPNYSGTIQAISNTFSTFAGVISPYLIGLLTPDSTLAQWRIAFWVCFAVMVVTNIVYYIWADGDQQWWDDVREHGYPPGWLGKHGPINKDLVKEEISTQKPIALNSTTW